MVFTRPTRCSNGGCLVVTFEDGRVLLRDSKLGDASPTIGFTPSEWGVFLTVAGEWGRKDTVMASGIVLSTLTGVENDVCLLDVLSLTGSTRTTHLHFTAEEWDAFVAGARAREFDSEVLAS